jgi:DNA polymerase-3 subunit epsilon
MSLSSNSPPIAVIDVETTGLFPFRQDRIIEMAAVIVRPDGAVEREFDSLINPARDVGATRIHGLTSQDILQAPRFEEIAGLLMEVLEGTVAVAAHNVRFDRQFLESELSRLGFALPDCLSVCTMCGSVVVMPPL